MKKDFSSKKRELSEERKNMLEGIEKQKAQLQRRWEEQESENLCIICQMDFPDGYGKYH